MPTRQTRGVRSPEKHLEHTVSISSCEDIIVNVLNHRDRFLSALQRTHFHESDFSTTPPRDVAKKHRPIPRRIYLIGFLIYTGAIAAAVGAATWAVLVL